MAVCKSGREFYQNPIIAGTLILNFQPPELQEMPSVA
jgi:hypothetical protein